jgi:hypothetical protein
VRGRHHRPARASQAEPAGGDARSDGSIRVRAESPSLELSRAAHGAREPGRGASL